MASRPYFEATGRGRWRLRYWDGRWRQATLGPHPGPWDRSRPPQRPPAAIERAAARYREVEVAAREGRGEGDGPAGIGLEEALAAYGASYALGHAANSVKALRSAAGHLRAFCAGLSIDRLERFTEAHARQYLENRLRARAARATVVTERSFLAPFFSWLEERGSLPANPFAKAKVPGRRKLEEAPYWTREELARLVDAADDGWCRDYLVVGVNTGLRCASMTHLRWDDVDFDRGVIRVRAALEGNKGARAYDVPLTATARRVLEARERRWPIVFGDDATGNVVGNRAVYGRLHRVVLRAGLPEKGHYAHILRHSFASHAVMAGVPLTVVSRWLGHANITQTMRYAHLAPGESLAQAQKLDIGA